MNALITGTMGFVGPYLWAELKKYGFEVFGLDRSRKENDIQIYEGDILDKEFVDVAIKECCPSQVFHLAGFSSVRKSFDYPELVYEVNVEGTRNLLESVSRYSPDSKVLIVSSAEVYGKPEFVPINEKEPLKVGSPYSKSRIDQEELLNSFSSLDIVVARSFNHTGPGQGDTFVLPSFVKQVVRIEKRLADPVIMTGNLDVVRDFSDVRDVVRAYRMLLEKGKRGQVYNVGSGVGYNLRKLLEKIISKVDIEIEVKVGPDRVRPIDIPELVADISKIKRDIGWEPFFSIDRTLDDILDYWYFNL